MARQVKGAVTPNKLQEIWNWLGDRFESATEDPYSGASSFQKVSTDLELAAGAGKNAGDSAFLSPGMGNLIGDALTKTANYLAGWIGAFSVTGTKASRMPSGALMGVVMDGVTEVDAAVVAVIDGSDPSAQTNAVAAFGVRQINNHASSGVEYGINLHDPGDETLMTDAEPFKISKAVLRSPNEVCYLEVMVRRSTAPLGTTSPGRAPGIPTTPTPTSTSTSVPRRRRSGSW